MYVGRNTMISLPEGSVSDNSKKGEFLFPQRPIAIGRLRSNTLRGFLWGSGLLQTLYWVEELSSQRDSYSAISGTRERASESSFAQPFFPEIGNSVYYIAVY